jgi:hypothetical protein
MTMLAAGAVSITATGAFATGSDATAEVRALEDQILALARANTTNADRAPIRAQLDPLVDALVALVPKGDEADSLPHVARGWKTEWSDLQIDPRADKSAVFQVVSAAGHYWNITRYLNADGTVLTNFLRGAFTPEGPVLNIRFTDDLIGPGWPASGTSLIDLAAQAEAGVVEADRIADSFAYQFAGTLDNIYVSDRLRIVRNPVGPQGTILFVSAPADTI